MTNSLEIGRTVFSQRNVKHESLSKFSVKNRTVSNFRQIEKQPQQIQKSSMASVDSSKCHFYPIYDWVNEVYLTQVLESHRSRPAIIHSHSIDYAAKRGENYRSALYRADVAYTANEQLTDQNANENCRSWLDGGETKRKCFVIKAKLYDTNATTDSRRFIDNMFRRERIAYQQILTKCSSLMANCGQPTAFAPK